MTRVLVLGALILCAASAAQAAAPASPLVLQADSRLAGFKVSGGTLGRAIRVFGAPTSMRALPGYQRFCDARWATVGLVIRFFAAGCTGKAHFVAATASGERWQTIRRLRIGDSSLRLRTLYPDARPIRMSDGRQRWRLFRRGDSSAGLVAITAGEEVTSFVLSGHFVTRTIGS